MHQKQTGRVIFILVILLAALAGIFQRQVVNLFKDVPWSQKTMLRPGIDMVGGTSLLYQIKEPVGGFHSPDGHTTLAEAVMAALKRRIDPDGVKNYIWRPQGENRLEIQIPASSKNDEALAARDAYVKAQSAVEALNIRPQAVASAVETLTGPARTARLAQLAAGVPERTKLFEQMVQAYDAMQAAHTRQDAAAEAVASNDYDRLKTQIDATNIKPSQLEFILEKAGDARAKALADLKQKNAGLTDRLKAIDEFTAAYDAYRPLKNSIDDAGELKRDLQGSGVLEFHITVSDGELSPQLESHMIEQLKKKGPHPEAGDEVAWYQLDKPENFHGIRTVEFDNKQYVLCWITPGKEMINGPGLPRWQMENARAQNDDGAEVVGLKLDAVGGKLFHDLTAPNINKPLAAVLDHKVISIANINAALGSDFQISGDFSSEELQYLVTTFNAGSLPATLEDEPISEHTVGPQLGAANLRQGLYACGFGLITVAVFLICYYYLAGVVATIAVLMNIVLILGVLAAFGATFTLPGIAGIVLTIGAAVDANVLIFERLREEQHMGLSLRMAMRNAYEHAQSAIWDSNATTIITSVILMWLGSEEVKGFGTTLLIGLLSSLFTSLFVTRTIFNIMIDTFHVKTLSSIPLTFPKWDKLLKPNFDWMRITPIFWAMSAVFIGAGMIAFVAKAEEHELADVDFTSGTQVQFDLRKPMSLDEIRHAFEAAPRKDVDALPSVNLTSIGSDSKVPDTAYELVTANADAKAVRSAVLDVLGSRILTDLPSKFDHVGDPVDVAINAGVVDHVTPAYTVKDLNDFKTPASDDYIGGVAVVLKNLDPPLKPDQIRDRLDRMRASLPTNSNETAYPALAEYTVVSPLGPGVATTSAVVFASDPNFPYDKDPAKWTANVADKVWELVKDGVNHEGRLQKVNTFGPQVAGDNQQAAFFALILSSVVIMVYIWLRFGNLKYGTATVLAMIHDVALVVGAVGLSHYVAKLPWLATALMVEPFRVNLTIVAAVLTVMSYSMIDTIVVFDRIRENRMKFGYLSKKIVNDSINQTLSRTLLTAGTTIVTVAGMYVVGGPGIHGFTFVLLVGILVGTYSSIAIAAPFLLIGADQGKTPRPKPPATGALQRVSA
jgi:SecD/SecF fusion protein